MPLFNETRLRKLDAKNMFAKPEIYKLKHVSEKLDFQGKEINEWWHKL